MRIVYMGTPDFSVAPLQALYDAGYDIPLVVTRPDQARDRGKKTKPTPVKELALELGIPVLSPETLKGACDGGDQEDFWKALQEAKPDCIVVAAYGQILPKHILDLPKYGCINIHASLLPRWRGAAPIQRSILEGDSETGVTIMYMAEKLDAGDMLAKVATPTAGKTAGGLHDELSQLGAKLLIDTLPALFDGTVQAVPQDESLVTYAAMVFKKDGLVDFAVDPQKIEWQIRGLSPWPGAYTFYHGQQMKLLEASMEEKSTGKPDGTLAAVAKDHIVFAAGGKSLVVTKIQMPGKKAMPVSEYLKGNKLEAGTLCTAQAE